MKRRGGPGPARHGTKSKYSLGCRCDRCRQANTEDTRRRRLAGGVEATMPRIITQWRCVTCGRLQTAEMAPEVRCGHSSPLEGIQAAWQRVYAECRRLRIEMQTHHREGSPNP